MNLKLHFSITFMLLVFFVANAQELELTQIALGLDDPVDITHAGDERLFIVEQDGTIRIIDENGDLLSTPFLDIDSKVNSFDSERGLLGLAFHPDYANNGYFFVNYTAASSGTIFSNGTSVIARFQVSTNDPNIADSNSEEIILTADQPYWNHNAGDLAFGPDGYLYIGFGDGGSGGDPENRSQNTSTFMGKMLRIDVSNGLPYTIPTDNPFVGDANILDEIWAIGIRNPWRYSFDRMTGDLWIADVGQNSREEIHMQPAASTGGENYGWRCYEGFDTYNTNGCGSASDYVEPVHDFPHSAGACSVTGGYVYRGSEYPDLYGHYIYGDYCNGKIWSLTSDGNGGWNNVELEDIEGFNLSTFGEDVHGELYLAKHGQGRIYKVGTALCAGFEVSAAVDDTNGTINLTVSGGSGGYTYEWSNGETTEDLENLSSGDYTYTVTDNTTNCSVVNTVNLFVCSTPEISMDGNTLIATAGFETYQWYFNGNIINDATSAVYMAEFSGEYTVEATGPGCDLTSEPVTVTITDIEDLNTNILIEATPNPFKNIVTLTIEIEDTNNAQIELVDITGKLVRNETMSITQSLQKELDLSALAAGVYFLKVKTSEGEAVKRLVKE